MAQTKESGGLDLGTMPTEWLMRLQADIGDEIERRYRESKRLQREKAGACDSKKMGEYNPLRCVRQKGHDGEHNYVVDSQYGAAK